MGGIDMETIKERAEEYNNKYFSKNDDTTQTLAKVAYIAGATEQKAIDDEEINALYSIMEQSASVLGIGTMWLNENARQVAIAELREKILKYLKEYT